MKKLFFFLISFPIFLWFLGPPVFAAQIYDLANSSSYNLRFDGAAANDEFSTFELASVDLNNNGKPDIIVGAGYADNNSRSNSGSVYIIYDSLIDGYSGTGNNIDMANSANYNLRFDGAAASNILGAGTIAIADLDNNGRLDLLLGAPGASNNSRSTSGSIYVIYDSLISNYSGTGNNLDLATATNYNLRFDGAAATHTLSYGALTATDLNNNGKNDILVGAYDADYNSRTNSGSIYVIYDSLISNYSGTGNNLDLATATNYNLRFDGAAASNRLSIHVLVSADLNSNGKNDILVGAYPASNNSRSSSGSLYVIFDSLIDDYPGAGNVIDLATSTNYNLRYDGAATSDQFAFIASATDVNNDGKTDVLAGALNTDNNSRSNSGSLYLIYNTLIDDYSGTGNNIDLATSSNYNLRYDGAAVNDYFSSHALVTADIDGNGKIDILAAGFESKLSRSRAGTLYVVYDSLTGNYSGTGNNIDIADSANYSLRFDGAVASYYLAYHSLFVSDLDSDGTQDILVGADYASYNSRTNSGSLYVIYNFPHSLSLNSVSSLTRNNSFGLSGNITASNSVTDITKVQYSVDDSSFSGWTDCSCLDGSFDSKSESFNCPSFSSLTEGKHNIYLRASDTNNSYTGQAGYLTQILEIDTSPPQILELAIANVSLVSSGKVYELPITNRTPSFTGKVVDYYQGSEVFNTARTSKQVFAKVCSGPEKVVLNLKKQAQVNVYQDHLTKEYTLTGIQDLAGQEKSTRFHITTPYPLIDGYYQVEISSQDKAGNIFRYPAFYLSLNYQKTKTTTVSSSKPSSPTPIPSPESLPEIKGELTQTPQSITQPPQNILSQIWEFIKRLFKR